MRNEKTPHNIVLPLFMLTKNNLIAAAFSYALTIALANVLGPVEFGKYSLVLLVGSILSIWANFCTDQTAPLLFSKTGDRRTMLGLVFGLRIRLMLLCAIGLGIYAPVDAVFSYYVLCLLPTALNLGYVYESFSRNVRYSYIYLAERLVYVGTVFAVINFATPNIGVVLSIFLIATLSSLAFQYWEMYIELVNMRRIKWKDYYGILRANIPLVVIALALFAYGGFSRILLENRLGTEALGIYSAGWQLITIGTLFQSQVTRVWRLKISIAVVQRDAVGLRELMKSYIVYATVPFFIPAVVMFALPNAIVTMLFSPSYASLASVVPIFGFYFLVINLAGLAEMLWVAIGKNVTYMNINLLFSIVLLSVLGVLPAEIGIAGFAASTVITHLIATITLLSFWWVSFRNDWGKRLE